MPGGDYDADGDLDIVLTGADGANLYSKVYQNRGSRGGFDELSVAKAPLLPSKMVRLPGQTLTMMAILISCLQETLRLPW
ncbi:MAG: hypothetical protein R3C61_14670 [Bacteroidia bacterium]